MKESFVVIGRCADFILKDYPNVVRVFVHAPLEHCVKVLESMNSSNAKDLEQEIIKKDKYRAAYYHYYTGRNWNDARNYDLCLNSRELSFEKCVEIVKQYLKIKMS